MTASAFSTDQLLRYKKVTDFVVFFREDGKPIYSYEPKVSGNISVSTTIREKEVEKAGKWYLLLREDQSLERPVNLFVASLQTEDNNFRSFLSAWSALEIFVNKTFSLYENILFQKLNEGNHPAVRKQYLDRI